MVGLVLTEAINAGLVLARSESQPMAATVARARPSRGVVYNHHPKLVLACRGVHDLELPDGRCRLLPGGILYFPPGSWHRIMDGRWRTYASVIAFKDRLRFHACRRGGRTATRHRRVIIVTTRPEDSALDHLWSAISVMDDGVGLHTAAVAIWERACTSLQDGSHGGEETGTWDVVEATIASYIHQPLTRAKVAEMCGISPGYLSELCRRETGARFIDVLGTARMRHAEHLLKSSDATVAEVADALHFRDVRHFRRVFKRYRGVAPGGIRGSEG